MLAKTTDNTAIEPNEKSNLPEFKLVDKEIVVYVVTATFIMNIENDEADGINLTLFIKQITSNITKNNIGINNVPIMFLIILLLFMFTSI